jgi:hypothetical protein
LVQHKFSEKSKKQMLDAQIEGSKSKNKTRREPRNPQQDYENALHRNDTNEWYGHPASAFRAALISACRVSGIVMTKAKLSVFVEADGLGVDGTPLVRLYGEPEIHEASVRLESGVASIAIRPMWREWSAKVSVTFDADQLDLTSVTNLLARAGQQVGIGEGRPDSKKSTGQGWGRFLLDTANVLYQEGGVVLS